jgi:hypothetical protein
MKRLIVFLSLLLTVQVSAAPYFQGPYFDSPPGGAGGVGPGDIVSGPVLTTLNAFAVWNDVTGSLLRNSVGLIDLSGNISGISDVSLRTLSSDTSTTITMNLGVDAGDDFIVGPGNHFVIEGDSGRIGVNTSTPSAKSIMHMVSTTEGFLKPVMTTAERVAIAPLAADQGLEVYDSDIDAPFYWDGTAWVEEGGSGSGDVLGPGVSVLSGIATWGDLIGETLKSPVPAYVTDAGRLGLGGIILPSTSTVAQISPNAQSFPILSEDYKLIIADTAVGADSFIGFVGNVAGAGQSGLIFDTSADERVAALTYNGLTNALFLQATTPGASMELRGGPSNSHIVTLTDQSVGLGASGALSTNYDVIVKKNSGSTDPTSKDSDLTSLAIINNAAAADDAGIIVISGTQGGAGIAMGDDDSDFVGGMILDNSENNIELFLNVDGDIIAFSGDNPVTEFHVGEEDIRLGPIENPVTNARVLIKYEPNGSIPALVQDHDLVIADVPTAADGPIVSLVSGTTGQSVIYFGDTAGVTNKGALGYDGSTNEFEVSVEQSIMIAVEEDGVMIGSTDPVNADALLQMNTTTQGILFPRMTTAQREAITNPGSPSESLWVYDTDLATFLFCDGSPSPSCWLQMLHEKSPLSGGGSTTDNAIARWDGTDATTLQNSNSLITDGGLFGIDTIDPKAQLHILEGSSAEVTPTADTVVQIQSDDLASTDVGVSLTSGNDGVGSIRFASTADTEAARVDYDHAAMTMDLVSEGSVAVVTGAGANDLFTVDTDALAVQALEDEVGIRTADPRASLHILAGGTSQGGSAAANLIVQSTALAADDNQVNVISGAAGSAGVHLGDPAQPSAGRLDYDNSSDTLELYVAETNIVDVTTGGMAVDVAGAPSLLGTDAVITAQNSALTGDDAAISVIGGNTGESALYLGSPAAPEDGRIRYDSTGDLMQFRTKNIADVVTLTSSRMGVNVIPSLGILQVQSVSSPAPIATVDDTIALIQNDVAVGENSHLVLVGGTAGQTGVHFNDSATGTTTAGGKMVYDHASGDLTIDVENSVKIPLNDAAGDEFTVDETTLVVNSINNNVGIGTATPSTAAALDIVSTKGALIVPRMTNAQRDVLAAVGGMVIWSTDDSCLQEYDGTVWGCLDNNIASAPAYGAMYSGLQNPTGQTVDTTADDTLYDWTAGSTDGDGHVTVVGGIDKQLQINAGGAGSYRYTASMQTSASNIAAGEAYIMELYKNGVAVGASGRTFSGAQGNEVINMTFEGIVNLAATDVLDLRLRVTTGTETVNIYASFLSINRVED